MADDDSRAGTRYYSTEILAYGDRVHAGHDSALGRAFAVPDGIPRIQVGQSEGKLLELFVQLVGATKIVEIGTLVGYSAVRMARALRPGGQLWSIEYEPRHAEVARANIAAAGLADRATVLVGSAREVLPTLVDKGPFDVVFIDADKEGYDDYGQWALENLRPGGLVIGDNAYLFGELLEDSSRGRGMRAFHERVAAHCDSVCIPTPDGLVVGIKR
jgi:caffeoyl-CoA O-methyltransferase